MLFRSTGLGDTELVGTVQSLESKKDYLIMHVDVTDPVKWKVRAALTFGDLLTVGLKCLTFKIIFFFLSPIRWFKKEPEHPGEY